MIVFYTSRKERRLEIARRFAAGALQHGDAVRLHPIEEGIVAGKHVAVIVGNKIALGGLAPGCRVVRLDRAYAGSPDDYARISIDAAHPTRYLTRMGCSDDRRRRFGWAPRLWRRSGTGVLLLGGSMSYYIRRGVLDVRQHLADIAAQLEAHTNRPVLYRAKPSMARDYPSIPGAYSVSSYGPMDEALAGIHAVVVEESAASVEALLAGVPAIVLDQAPTWPISSNLLEHVEAPAMCSSAAAEALLNDLAYFQYSQAEIEDGTAWGFIRRLL